MNIGIYIDGTLTDIGKYQLETGRRYFGRDAAEPTAFDIGRIFDCSPYERGRYWKKYIWAYCLRFPPYKNAAQVLRKLHRDGHRVVIVTSRVYTAEKSAMGLLFRLMLLYWLKKNRIYYDEIIYCADDKDGSAKLKACREKRIHIMIDDKPENLSAIADRLKVICFPAAWNKKISDDRFIRVSGWKNIYQVIQKFKG